jgi:hypothetical protein
MKKNTILSILIIALTTLVFSCDKKPEKPIITLQKFAFQKMQMTAVIDKLFSEPNIKIMNAMADGVESTRAIDCTPVGEECNLYYGVINKVVNVTADGELSEQDRQVLNGLKIQFDKEVASSEKKLKQQWKDVTPVGPKEVTKP